MTGPLCGARHRQYPETLCTELTGHDRADGSPHTGLLIIDGREAGAIAWNEPKETPVTAPRPLPDADLLAWAVVLGYRDQQERDGLKILLVPFPPCPTCGEAVHEATAGWVREPFREEVTIDVQPCGHAHRATQSDLERIHDHASEMLAQIRADSERPAGESSWNTERIIAEARARVGQSGQAATEATEPDVCSGCRYVPCGSCSEAPLLLRERVVQAIRDTPARYPDDIAAAVLAAILGPIPAGTDTATWTTVRALQLMNEAGVERDKALAAVERVRALPPYDRPVHGDTSRGVQIGWDRARQAAHNALDGEQPAPTPAATEATGVVCAVTVTVHAPTGENAGQWAETIRDLVVAEYGDSMRLEVTITPGGQP